MVGVGFGFVKEFSAPLLTLTKCFWPPQLQQAPLPPLLLSLLLSRNRSWCGCPLPQPPAPAAPFWLGSCQLICIIALYLFAAPSLRSCCSPTQLGLAHSLSHTQSLSLSFTLAALSLSLVLLFVCILVWDFRGIFVAFCLVNRGWLLVNTHTLAHTHTH